MTEIKSDNQIGWEPYMQGVARSRRLAGQYVTLTARGDMAISQELTDQVSEDKRWLRIEYHREQRRLRLTPIARSEPGSLAMHRPKGKGRQIRIGTSAGIKAWGIVPQAVTRYDADWFGGSIEVELDRPLAIGELPTGHWHGAQSAEGDLIDPVDRIDDAVVPISVHQRSSAVASPSASVSSVPSVAKSSSPDDDLIDILMVTQLAKCAEPTLYAWMKGKGFPRPIERRGKKCFWSRTAVAQWLVSRGGTKRPRASKPAAAKLAPTCSNCGDGHALGKWTICRSLSDANPNRNHSVDPTCTCDWHREPGAYVPVRPEEE